MTLHSDLICAVVMQLMLSAGVFFLGTQIGRKRFAGNLTAILAMVATLWFAIQLHGNLAITKLLPVSNAIILGNWFPLFASILAGVLYSHEITPHWRRLCLCLIILAASWLTVLWNAIPFKFSSKNEFKNGVCLQSHPSTCSACSVVTLLDCYHITSDEREMATLCLTSGRGTQLLGIYRGLKIKTRGMPYRVNTLRGCTTPNDLKGLENRPAIIPVKTSTAVSRINKGSFSEILSENSVSSLAALFLGSPDHCVVFFGFTDDNRVLIGDPANDRSGVVLWPIQKFANSWTGEALFLEELD